MVNLAGQNKRYDWTSVDRCLEGRILRAEPMLLKPVEIDLEHHAPTEFPVPRRCNMWIRYPTKAVLIKAHVLAWNNRAIKIRFLEPTIKIAREGRMWTNAVTPGRER